MKIQAEQTIPATQQAVWQALNDPQVLKRCLSGCDVFELVGDGLYRVALQATVGPIRTRFTGKLQLSDLAPPEAYSLSFEGSGGVAGFGKGSARVRLEPVPGGTRLTYEARAEVGGRLAQVGARLIDGVTQKMANDFFTRFARELSAAQALSGNGAAVAGEAAQRRPSGESVGLDRSARVAVVAAVVSMIAAAATVVTALMSMGAVR